MLYFSGRKFLTMKHLTILLISFLTVFIMAFKERSVSDTYKVIKVDGNIVYQKSGKLMATGDQFLESEKLVFKTNESRAAVISSLKGRFILSAQNNGLSNNLLPAMNNVKTRSGALLSLIDLQNYFKGDFLVVDERKQKIAEAGFPMNETNFFYVQYVYNGEEIHKKLSYNGNELVISKAELFTIDGQAVATQDKINLKLWYRNAEEKKSLLIGEFTCVMPGKDEILKELDVISKEHQKGEEKKLLEDAAGFLNDFYGAADMEYVRELLKR
jgi:hypothetical protein